MGGFEQTAMFKLNAISKVENHSVSQDEIEITHYLEKTHSSLIPESFYQGKAYSVDEYSHIFYRGDLNLLNKSAVSVVGTRNPTDQGKARTAKVVKVLVDMNFVVVSGLAKGIDTIAHQVALKSNGQTIAVLGTPIHKIYPASNKPLADEIVNKGLLLSPALPHEESGKYLFPRRNRLMAQLSKATIIIEAGETSGVVHQAAECLRQNRLLILLKSLADNKQLTWIAGFLKSGAKIVETPEELLELLK